MFCKNCGQKLEDGAKYCSQCGHETGLDLEEVALNFKNGDQNLFESLYYLSIKKIGVIVRSFFPDNKQDQEDCLQSIYIKVYQNISKYDPQKGSFSTWIQTLAKNECISAWKRQKRNYSELSLDSMEQEEFFSTEIKDDNLHFNPEAKMEQKEISRLVMEILSELPEIQKQCVLMYYASQMKQSEISAALGIPEGTVKSRLYNGKKQIELRVLELEKKGTKLYSMSPFVFFMWLFLSEDGPNVNFSRLPIPEAHQIVESETTKLTTEAGKNLLGKSIGMKFVAAIAGAAILGGGTFGVLHHLKQDSAVSSENKKEEDSNIHKEKNKTDFSIDQLDQERLSAYLSYFPLFSKQEDITDPSFYWYAYTNTYENFVNNAGYPDLLNSSDVLSVDTNNYSITLNSVAFDEINQVLQISDQKMQELLGVTDLVQFSNDQILCFTNEGVPKQNAIITGSEMKEGELYVEFTWTRDRWMDLPEESQKRQAILEPSENSAGYTIQSISDISNSDIPSDYQKIINAYGNYYYSNGKDMDTQNMLPEDYAGFDDPYTGMGFGIDPSLITKIYYSLYDINQDGVDECIFTSDINVNNETGMGLYAIWTTDGVNAHQVVSGRYRVSHSICEDGTIRESLSGGYDSGEYIYYSFDTDGTCEIQDDYSYDTYDDNTQNEINSLNKKHPVTNISLDWIEIKN